MEWKKKWGGEKITSVPYWVMLDKNGNELGDSQIERDKNIGCPATAEEVTYFIKMLQKTLPITREQIAAIEKRLLANNN